MRVLATISLAWAALSCLPIGHAHAEGEQVFTAARAFDACVPMEDGRVLAAGEGGLHLIGKDGGEIARYGRKDGLLGTRFHAISRGPHGHFLVGGEAGISRIRLEGRKLRIVDQASGMNVRAIHRVEHATFLATWDQGLMVMDAKIPWNGGFDKEFVAVRGQSKGAALRATDLHIGADRAYWTTAGAGLWSVGLAERNDLRREGGLPESAILWSLHKDGDDLWVGGEDGLQSLRGGHAHGGFSVRASARLSGKHIIGSYGGGLTSLDGAFERPDDRFVRSLGEFAGTSCIGTESDVWIRQKGTRWKRARLRDEIPGGDVAAFVEDHQDTQRRAFVGTFEHGVAEWKDGSFAPLALDIDPHINALALDRKDGSLWIGTSTTLARYHKGRLTKIGKRDGLPSRHVMSLSALPRGGVLVGTASGAATVHGSMVEPLIGKGRVVTGNVWAVAHAHGAHWLGTTRGLFRVQDGRVNQYRLASGELPEDWVMALAPSEDGIFVGTYKSGVVRLRLAEGKKMDSEQLGEGWINPGGLSWDGSELRAATMYGAFRGDGKTSDWNKSEGPGRDTTVYLAAKDGGEWIVTRRGIAKR